MLSRLFGRPGRAGPAVFAVLVMLAGAWVGAYAGSRLAWESAPALPSGAEADRLSATAFPGLRVFGGGTTGLIEPFGDGEGVKYASVSYWVKHTDATRDVATYSAGVRDRLAAAGWEIHDFRVDAPEPLVDGGATYRAGFWATRPGLVLNFADYLWTERPPYDSPGAAAFDLWRAPPPGVEPAARVGAVSGALLGLLLTVFVSRRTARYRWSGPVLGAATGAALFLLLPTVLVPGGEQPMDSPWWGGFHDLGQGPALLSAAIATLIVLFALVGPGPARAAARLGSAAARLARATGRPSRTSTGPNTPSGLREHRRPLAVAALALIAVGAAIALFVMPRLGAGQPPCRPTGLPAEPPAALTRTSTLVKIFVSNTATADERNLIDAAIFRSRAGSLGEFVWRPDSAGFRDTYCGGGRIPDSAVASLPYYFAVDLADVANLPALLEEVNGLAGVVAVQRALPED